MNNKAQLNPPKWYERYHFRIQRRDTDLSLFGTDFDNPQSGLSPLTNVTLNILTSANAQYNFIICIPSMTLRPIPFMAYILADQSKKSVIVYTRNKEHYNNYYSLKIKYPRNWAYVHYPAGKIERGSLNIELYRPSAKTSFRKWFKSQVPELRRKFFNENYPKILFNLSRNIRFSDSVSKLNLYNETIETSGIKLGIGNLIFENIDNYIYNSSRFESFAKWIGEFRDDKHRFIFHISNPNYGLLNDLKNLIDAYVLYFPFSFIKANEDLNRKNKKYFKKLNPSNSSILNLINLDNQEIYNITEQGNIKVEKPLKRGNIDKYFNRGIKLFENIKWNEIHESLVPIIHRLRDLYYNVYKMFCIPNDFSVKYFNEELVKWSSFHLEYYLKIAYGLFKKHSKGPTFQLLRDISTFLYKMASELSECKRYKEPKSYSRKGKNCALCEFLEENSDKKIIIGVQTGEKQLVHSMVDSLLENGHVQVSTLRTLARSIKDVSEYTLILPGQLFTNHFQIFFKNWKEIRFFVYRGKNQQHVKRQIDLLNHLDISKEELSLNLLSKIFKDIIGASDEDIQQFSMFRDFIEKKKRFLRVQEVKEDKRDVMKEKSSVDYFKEDITIKTSSITDILKDLMKSNSKYKEMISEEKARAIVKRYHKKSNEKYLENVEKFDCIALLQNENTGDTQTVNLDVGKKYLYFVNKENINIKSCFGHSLKENYYVILFGDKEKLSMSDFVKEAFGLEEDIDHDLIYEWQARISSYFLHNYPRRIYAKFHRNFVNSTPSNISSTQFNNWVKGNTNYTQDPMSLYYLGQLMEDDFFTDNYKLIHDEGVKLHRFNLKLGKKLKKLVVQVLDGNISRADCSPEELLLLENIENCIFKIKNIRINK